MSRKLQNLIYKMLTENTGSHFLDSGGAHGRNWQRNAKKGLKDFQAAPECTLELSRWKDSIEASVTINVFHYLTNKLELDELCDKFNRRKVADWDSNEFYGVSTSGEKFLLEHFEVNEDSFNTYNWGSDLSQVLQGRMLKHKESGDEYVVLQIHGGCDVRGGYTDAKLFKIDCEYLFSEHCYFNGGIDWLGEFIDREGTCSDQEAFQKLADAYKLGNEHGSKIKIEGSIV